MATRRKNLVTKRSDRCEFCATHAWCAISMNMIHSTYLCFRCWVESYRRRRELDVVDVEKMVDA